MKTKDEFKLPMRGAQDNAIEEILRTGTDFNVFSDKIKSLIDRILEQSSDWSKAIKDIGEGCTQAAGVPVSVISF